MAPVLKLAKFFFPQIKFIKLMPWFFIFPAVVFQALSLTGCISTSPGIPNIYIVSLRSNTNTSTPVQVRIGYFGICGIDEDGTRCMSATGHSVEEITPIIFPSLATSDNNNTNTNTNSSAVPEEIVDLINTATHLRDTTFNSILAASSILFVVGFLALLVHKRDIKNDDQWDKIRLSTWIKRATYGTLYLSAAGTFAASMATTQAAKSLEFTASAMKDASVLIKSGTTLQVFQWIAFGFSITFALLVPILAHRKSKKEPEEYYKEQEEV
ncbi:Ca2+ regulator and membrane fusion protein Fig1-domain-containing protein [Podospora australis]|uniref:Ca2+ regulator and membrane fusion protein Fig1-domain-containing protein n=1 Tax=Podospora australis TaxID=1536484 RepID=A0AAN6WVV3_9PEZI|nr:Ca2+ regulator and membrane fusion protein Fig1-domain-containing protein [Podospora australis]